MSPVNYVFVNHRVEFAFLPVFCLHLYTSGGRCPWIYVCPSRLNADVFKQSLFFFKLTRVVWPIPFPQIRYRSRYLMRTNFQVRVRLRRLIFAVCTRATHKGVVVHKRGLINCGPAFGNPDCYTLWGNGFHNWWNEIEARKEYNFLRWMSRSCSGVKRHD